MLVIWRGIEAKITGRATSGFIRIRAMIHYCLWISLFLRPNKLLLIPQHELVFRDPRADSILMDIYYLLGFRLIMHWATTI